MDYLNWELTILSRAVAFSNISTAAANIGLSQPQISRIVSKIEKSLGLILLDRDARRKSAWTSVAYKVAELYAQREAQLRTDLAQLSDQSQVKQLRAACLDGLATVAMAIGHSVAKAGGVEVFELNLHDLSILEERFLKGDYDFILTSREPGRKKFSHRLQLGYQTLETLGAGRIEVLSTFEFVTGHNRRRKKAQAAPVAYVSNALVVRQSWIEKYQGRGVIPSAVQKKKPAKVESHPAWLIASETVPMKFWQAILDAEAELKA